MAVSRKADLETYVDTFTTRMRAGLVQMKVANDLDGARISDRDEVLSTEDIGYLMSVMGDPNKPVFAQMADVLDDLLVAKGWAKRDAPVEPVVAPVAPVAPIVQPDPVAADPVPVVDAPAVQTPADPVAP